MFLNPPGSLWSASQSLTTRVCGPWYGSPEGTESHLLPPDGQCSGHEYQRRYDLHLTWTLASISNFTVKTALYFPQNPLSISSCLLNLKCTSVLTPYFPVDVSKWNEKWDLYSKCMTYTSLTMNQETWWMKPKNNEKLHDYMIYVYPPTMYVEILSS